MMRIRELFEVKKFKENEYVDIGDHKINYDLVDDMVCFMNNDDGVYRKNLYPIISNFKKGDSNNAQKLKPAVIDAYETYVEKYPIKKLPSTLNNETCKKICEKFYDEITKEK